MKTRAGLVNIGRQSIVDYDALCDKLEEGSLAGAIVDVFDAEPIAASSRLWNTRNLIITPHVSADDGDAYVPMTIDLVPAQHGASSGRQTAAQSGAPGTGILAV